MVELMVFFLVKSIPGKVTLIQLVDIFRGSASKKSLKYENLTLYGSGKGLTRGDAERLAQTLVTQQVLEEFCETNGLGFVSSYVRVGRDASSLESGRRRISMINHVEDEPRSRQNNREVKPAKGRKPMKFTGGISQSLEAMKRMDDTAENFLDDDFYDFHEQQQHQHQHQLSDKDEIFIDDEDDVIMESYTNDDYKNNQYKQDSFIDDDCYDDDNGSETTSEQVVMDEEPYLVDAKVDCRQLSCFNELLQLRESVNYCLKFLIGYRFV